VDVKAKKRKKNVKVVENLLMNVNVNKIVTSHKNKKMSYSKESPSSTQLKD